MFIKDYRPIACCNKAITKILAQMMPSLVLTNESAFVTNRLMQHNILFSKGACERTLTKEYFS